MHAEELMGDIIPTKGQIQRYNEKERAILPQLQLPIACPCKNNPKVIFPQTAEFKTRKESGPPIQYQQEAKRWGNFILLPPLN